MSAERITRRALRGVAVWRLVGECLAAPRRILMAVCEILDRLEYAAFYMELDAARRYYALTGIDIAEAAGDEVRYESIRKA